jgi:hypothetical protein
LVYIIKQLAIIELLLTSNARQFIWNFDFEIYSHSIFISFSFSVEIKELTQLRLLLDESENDGECLLNLSFQITTGA